MRKLTAIISLTIAVLHMNSGAAYAENHKPKGISCVFTQDSFDGGKSNSAECAGSPESIFSSANGKVRHPSSNHCKISEVYTVNKFEDFYINFDEKKVSYKLVKYYSDMMKNFAKNKFLKDGKTQQEAEKLSNFREERNEEFKIDEFFITEGLIFSDPTTGEPFKNYIPKKQKRFNVVFDNRIFQIADGIPEAIITEFETYGDKGWLSMRFGQSPEIFL